MTLEVVKTQLHKEQQTLFELVHHDGPGRGRHVVGGVLLGVRRGDDGHQMVAVTGRHLAGKSTLSVRTVHSLGHRLKTNAQGSAFKYSALLLPLYQS